MSSHFDLDKSVAAWRRRYEHDPAFTAEDVRELEQHVRDQVQALVDKGHAEEEAFLQAMRDMGEHEEVRAAFRNVLWSKRRREQPLPHLLMTEAAMLKNYLTIASRNLRRQKGYAFINVSGLAVGMACCLLIAAYVLHQLRYDRFHENANRIYRVTSEQRSGDQETRSAMTPPGLADLVVRSFPEVEQATRLWRDPPGTMVVRYGDRAFREEQVVYADSNLFEVFSFPLLQGDPGTVLRDPFSIVITEEAAQKYFGDEDPMGKTLVLRVPADNDLWEYRVTGVAADPPPHSHVQFDFLASFSSHNISRSGSLAGLALYTYFSLREDADPEGLENRLRASLNELTEAEGRFQFLLQPLTRIHLHSQLLNEFGPTGDIRYVYFFAAVALFILLLACANFVNLSTALAAGRAKEVGVRKALGSARGELIRQFLAESALLSMLALVFAILLTGALLPVFNRMDGNGVLATVPPLVITAPILFGFALLVGTMAGFYPAFVLSSFRVMTVLKAGGTTGSGPSRLRNALIVFQIAVSVVLMVGTIVVDRQMRYVQETRLGFEDEQVIILEGAETMRRGIETFKQEALALPGVTRATNSELVPSRPFSTAFFRAEDMPEDARVPLQYTYASFDFVETLGLEIKEGRSLSRAFAGDSLAVILNETAVERLGLQNPVGKQLIWPNEATYTIVGVVQDFHVTSLRQEIGPVALLGPDPRNTNRPNLLVSLRVATNDLPQTIAALENTWEAFTPDEPFVYSFLDQNFDAFYQQERFSGLLFRGFAAIALLLACIGLLGLTTLAARQRTKEVGIRKVLGASVLNIAVLLTKDFVKLAVIAFLVAVPVAYYFMSRWLEDFAYRIELGPGIFLLAGGLALFIALITVSYQAIRAGLADPVKSLRYE
jgi:putative ABC transport system permease protein